MDVDREKVVRTFMFEVINLFPKGSDYIEAMKAVLLAPSTSQRGQRQQPEQQKSRVEAGEHGRPAQGGRREPGRETCMAAWGEVQASVAGIKCSRAALGHAAPGR